MDKIAQFTQRYGVWIFFTGAITLLLASYFLDSVWGVVFFVAGLLIVLIDPVVHLLGVRRGALEKIDRGLVIAWGLAAAAFAFFFIRFFLEAPAAKLAEEGALLPRLRLALLFLFLLSFFGAILYRLMLGLSFSVEAHANLTLEQQRRGYLTGSLYSMLALVPALALINYAATLRNPSLDLSPGYFSFSENGRSVIRSIERDVQVYAFLPDKQLVRRRSDAQTQPELFRIEDDIRTMVDQLPVANPRIKVNYLNADLETFNTTEFGNVSNGTVVFRVLKQTLTGSTDDKPYVERRVYITTEKDLARFEREVVRALVFVASPQRTVYFTAANGERYGLPTTQRTLASVEAFKEQLRFFNANLRQLDTSNNWPGPIPADADALYILGPTLPFAEPARQATLDYLKAGGRVFVAVDPEGRESFDWLFKELGGAPYAYKRANLTNTTVSGVLVTDGLGAHPIAEDIGGGGLRRYIIAPLMGYLEEQSPANAPAPTAPAEQTPTEPAAPSVPEAEEQKSEVAETPAPRAAVGTLRDLLPTTLLSSTYNSWDDVNRNARRDNSEAAARYTLGVAYEKPNLSGGPRLVVFSGVDWLSERYLQFPVENVNMPLATQALFWMTENPLAAGLAPEERESRSVQVTDGLKFRLILLGLVVFPLGLTGGLALAVALYRRKRKFVEEAT